MIWVFKKTYVIFYESFSTKGKGTGMKKIESRLKLSFNDLREIIEGLKKEIEVEDVIITSFQRIRHDN